MNNEMTRLLMGSVLMFVQAMEFAAIGLTGFGWCLLGLALARKARPATRFTGASPHESPPERINVADAQVESYDVEQGVFAV